ncbi:MAG: helix-turn-helix domain-containing protein [Methanoregula sp.]|jgi:excisionase family DNA binding protein|nr:helix-turn-helix domain-containing protein [Methanoregula sp.]
MKQLSAIDTNALQSDMPVEKSYSLKEAAENLGISVSGLRNWIRDGTIESYKVGEKLIRIKESEINKFTGKAAGKDPEPFPYTRDEIRRALVEVLSEPEFAEMIRSTVEAEIKRQMKTHKKG